MKRKKEKRNKEQIVKKIVFKEERRNQILNYQRDILINGKKPYTFYKLVNTYKYVEN